LNISNPPAKTTETNVVYYNPTTKAVSYGTVPTPTVDVLPITLDKTNNRVGINKTAPIEALDVTGNINTSGYTNINGALITAGNGLPESVVTAPVGSIFLRKDGALGTTVYGKTTGTGNTGWVNLLESKTANLGYAKVVVLGAAVSLALNTAKNIFSFTLPYTGFWSFAVNLNLSALGNIGQGSTFRVAVSTTSAAVTGNYPATVSSLPFNAVGWIAGVNYADLPFTEVVTAGTTYYLNIQSSLALTVGASQTTLICTYKGDSTTGNVYVASDPAVDPVEIIPVDPVV
jgi:hypothetical protein